jgi:GAF domain-containing protein
MANPSAFVQRENTRLKDEVKDLQAELALLRQFVSTLEQLFGAADNFKEDSELFPFLTRTLSETMALVNAPDGSLLLLDDETNELVFVIVQGRLAGKLTNHRIAADEGIAGWVMKHRQPVLIRDVQHDARFSSNVDTTFSFSTRSMIAAPLMDNHKIYGLIEVLNQPGEDPFSPHDVSLLKVLCRAAGEALSDIDRLGKNKPA